MKLNKHLYQRSTFNKMELLREEVLDRIISIMSEVKKTKQYEIYNKYETTLHNVINNFVIKNALDLISLIYYDTYFIPDKYLNVYIKQQYYEILNIIKMNIIKSDVIKKDIINCVTETVV